MFEMKRRRFLGVTAAATAAVALPVVAFGDTKPAKGQPAIGTEFHVGAWVGLEAREDHLPRNMQGAINVGMHALRRVEIERGVRLGRNKIDVKFHGDRLAWFVTSSAKVIGYA